jgi:hypothetical protein
MDSVLLPSQSAIDMNMFGVSQLPGDSGDTWKMRNLKHDNQDQTSKKLGNPTHQNQVPSGFSGAHSDTVTKPLEQ